MPIIDVVELQVAMSLNQLFLSKLFQNASLSFIQSGNSGLHLLQITNESANIPVVRHSAHSGQGIFKVLGALWLVMILSNFFLQLAKSHIHFGVDAIVYCVCDVQGHIRLSGETLSAKRPHIVENLQR